ncbi:MAG: type II toxin-antitoxin system death-on-curing family toxin [Thermomicrobiales bacterium]|nr:type II toxin-antitoxin system death-on-curing family toxin [Thermomicrobiales bacterium]
MSPIRYPSIGEVIAMHEYVLRKMGDDPRPLRDEGLLESAVMRPQMAAWYEGADLIRQAALLGTGISQAQAFIDGNKRTAFAAIDSFLWVNGWEITAEPLDLAQQLEGFAERSGDPAAIDDFDAFLRANVRERG